MYPDVSRGSGRGTTEYIRIQPGYNPTHMYPHLDPSPSGDDTYPPREYMATRCSPAMATRASTSGRVPRVQDLQGCWHLLACAGHQSHPHEIQSAVRGYKLKQLQTSASKKQAAKGGNTLRPLAHSQHCSTLLWRCLTRVMRRMPPSLPSGSRTGEQVPARFTNRETGGTRNTCALCI